MADDDNREHWMLDKKIPIALICAILGQAAALLIWGTRLDSRLSEVEAKAASAIERLDKNDGAALDVATKLARIEEWQRNAAAGSARIEAKIDKLGDRLDARAR